MIPELLAPAGDLEKVRIAFLYGADSVYIGGRVLSLRARASDFDLEGIKEAIAIARDFGKKLYVTTNIVPHDEDLAGIDEYLSSLADLGVDAIIVSDPYIISLAKKIGSLKIHISTQVSVANSRLCNYFKRLGASRIVLARELSLAEISKIRDKTETELEVFIHGGMCVSYSGRCTLSNIMTGRDANRGGCAHSCRWNYELYRNNSPFHDDFQIASRDLEAIEFLPALIDLGVDSFKIEGRMKSLHYIATVVRTYRRLIDDHLAGRTIDFDRYYHELARAENRPFGPGLFKKATLASQLYGGTDNEPSQDFIGLVLGYDAQKKEAIVEQRNHFRPGDKAEIITPDGSDFEFVIERIVKETGEVVDAARHPLEKVRIPLGTTIGPYALLRKVSN